MNKFDYFSHFHEYKSLMFKHNNDILGNCVLLILMQQFGQDPFLF